MAELGQILRQNDGSTPEPLGAGAVPGPPSSSAGNGWVVASDALAMNAAQARASQPAIVGKGAEGGGAVERLEASLRDGMTMIGTVPAAVEEVDDDDDDEEEEPKPSTETEVGTLGGTTEESTTRADPAVAVPAAPNARELAVAKLEAWDRRLLEAGEGPFPLDVDEVSELTELAIGALQKDDMYLNLEGPIHAGGKPHGSIPLLQQVIAEGMAMNKVRSLHVFLAVRSSIVQTAN
jgi:hypothetical protein